MGKRLALAGLCRRYIATYRLPVDAKGQLVHGRLGEVVRRVRPVVGRSADSIGQSLEVGPNVDCEVAVQQHPQSGQYGRHLCNTDPNDIRTQAR